MSAKKHSCFGTETIYKGNCKMHGGNGNHSISLPIMLIKIKVDQMRPSSYISSLLVSIL